MLVEQALQRLRAAGCPHNVEGMARYGIRPAQAYGAPAPAIRALAKEIGTDQALASKLWDTGVHDARILASLAADPASISEDEVERWVSQFDSWAVCDSACLAFLWRTPYAWRKVAEWSRREPEYVRRAAFALAAALAVHDKAAADARFAGVLKAIRRAATDDRNFVKKAVNWALRQTGKRNPELHRAALELAAELAISDSRPARWIGSDALRELRSPTVRERVAARARARRTQ